MYIESVSDTHGKKNRLVSLLYIFTSFLTRDKNAFKFNTSIDFATFSNLMKHEQVQSILPDPEHTLTTPCYKTM